MQKEARRNNRPEPAGCGWILVGVIFGPIGWLAAVMTDKGDGRAWMTVYGCLSWIIVIILFFVFG